jgi:hypothetical protein
MPERRAAPIIEGMSDDHRDDRRARLQRVATTILAIAVVSLAIRFAPLPPVDLPSIHFPDLPGWVGPAFRWVRWAVIGVVVVLAVVGAAEDRDRERS